jgi:hypothetical protein
VASPIDKDRCKAFLTMALSCVGHVSFIGRVRGQALAFPAAPTPASKV